MIRDLSGNITKEGAWSSGLVPYVCWAKVKGHLLETIQMERMWVPFRLLRCLVQNNEFDLSSQHIELVIGGCKPTYSIF